MRPSTTTGIGSTRAFQPSFSAGALQLDQIARAARISRVRCRHEHQKSLAPKLLQQL